MTARFTIFATVMMIVAVGFIGCNPTQWAAKEIIDGSGIQRGESLTVQLKNGEHISGTFAGTASMSLDAYADFYASTTQSEGTDYVLPSIGQRIRFSTILLPEKIWEGQLVGFDEQSILVRFNEETAPEKIYLTSLTSISSKQGDLFQRLQFRQIFLNGEIPLMTTIVLNNNSVENIQVPISSIKEVTIHGENGLAHSITLSAEQFLLNH